MPEKVIVPDTSVLLKWVLESQDESDRKRAIAIRDAWLWGQCTIVLPALWFFEVGNILGMKQPTVAGELLQLLTAYEFEEVPSAVIYAPAFLLMKKFKVTFYDAAYHATAINRAGLMITADEGYYRRASAQGHVSLLRDSNF
jgi:predicted nucleic acid-binding protein